MNGLLGEIPQMPEQPQPSLFDRMKQILNRGAPQTVNMQPQFRQYQIEQQEQGMPSMEWAQWLQSQGYTLGPDGHVYPIQQQPQQAHVGPLLR